MVSEDRELVERILSGEPEVFESLVRKYNRMAGAIAYGILGDFHEAEDVVQEAFLKAFRALSTLRDPGRFRSWFAHLVRTKSVDALRRRPARRPLELSASLGGGLELEDTLEESGRFPSSPGIEEEQSREESRLKVIDAIRELPTEDRLVVVLKHMEGLSYKEISEITGSTVGAVESRLFRARQQLKKRLSPSKT